MSPVVWILLVGLVAAALITSHNSLRKCSSARPTDVINRHQSRRNDRTWFAVAAISFDWLLAYVLLGFVSRSGPLFGVGVIV